MHPPCSKMPTLLNGNPLERKTNFRARGKFTLRVFSTERCLVSSGIGPCLSVWMAQLQRLNPSWPRKSKSHAKKYYLSKLSGFYIRADSLETFSPNPQKFRAEICKRTWTCRSEKGARESLKRPGEARRIRSEFDLGPSRN